MDLLSSIFTLAAVLRSRTSEAYVRTSELMAFLDIPLAASSSEAFMLLALHLAAYARQDRVE